MKINYIKNWIKLILFGLVCFLPGRILIDVYGVSGITTSMLFVGGGIFGIYTLSQLLR